MPTRFLDLKCSETGALSLLTCWAIEQVRRVEGSGGSAQLRLQGVAGVDAEFRRHRFTSDGSVAVAHGQPGGSSQCRSAYFPSR